MSPRHWTHLLKIDRVTRFSNHGGRRGCADDDSNDEEESCTTVHFVTTKDVTAKDDRKCGKGSWSMADGRTMDGNSNSLQEKPAACKSFILGGDKGCLPAKIRDVQIWMIYPRRWRLDTSRGKGDLHVRACVGKGVARVLLF